MFQGAKWYDWETGAAKQSGTIYADAKLGSIPVYQRGGTIVPTWQRIRRASSLMKDVSCYFHCIFTLNCN